MERNQSVALKTGEINQKSWSCDLSGAGVCWKVQFLAAMFVARQGCWEREIEVS